MRGVCLGLVLLLLAACKPVSRPPVSELTAVSDGNLTLGVVPVENAEGVHAYRLLVCRKSASYPKWMLEDSNRCRHALIDENGSEVVFLQDDLERDFATKYTGYAKAFVMPAIVGVGVFTIGYGAGSFVIKKGWSGAQTGWRHVRDFFKKVTGPVYNPIRAKFKQIPLGAGGIQKYRAAHQNLKAQAKLGETAAKPFPEGWDISAASMRAAVDEQEKILNHAENLHSLELEKSSLKRFTKMSEEKRADHLTKLKERNTKLADSESISNKLEIERNQRLIDGGNDAAAKRLASEIDPEITSARKTLDEAKDNATYSSLLAGATKKAVGWGAAAGVAATAGGAAFAADKITVAMQTIVDIDKSIWGYADRQTSMHWSQVFSESGLSNTKDVRNLQTILDALAETFGFRVNQRALALGN